MSRETLRLLQCDSIIRFFGRVFHLTGHVRGLKNSLKGGAICIIDHGRGGEGGGVWVYSESGQRSRTGSSHTVHREPTPAFLAWFQWCRCFCTFINISVAGIARSAQLSSPLPGQGVQYNIQPVQVLPVHHSTHHRLSTPVLQLGKPGRRDGSVL
jgi:hypothetical protein